MRTSDHDAVLDRAFRLLAAFTPDHGELTLAELAAASDLPRSTAHRLAGQLTEHGALERSARGWRLGLRLFELGQLVPRQERLRELALAHMQDLYELTHETIQLAVLDGGQVLYVEILSGHRKVPTPSRRGGRMPVHCTALGKALLAFAPDGGAAAVEAAGRLDARTGHTITDPQRLMSELHDVRRHAVAYDRQEASLGLRCVASPVLSTDGTARAALSVSLPAEDPRPFPEVAAAVRMAALALSRELRSQPDGSVLGRR
ncbi:MAG TPA: IclR family transcriptional regulator [Solirubrobacteraceae bacterium]|jgi:DNA-binding IclR family transcriptional regulator